MNNDPEFVSELNIKEEDKNNITVNGKNIHEIIKSLKKY